MPGRQPSRGGQPFGSEAGNPPPAPSGRLALRFSAGFFGLYVLNVLGGKLSTVSALRLPVSLGDVGEFVTLFAAAICFVVATLQREAGR